MSGTSKRALGLWLALASLLLAQVAWAGAQGERSPAGQTSAPTTPVGGAWDQPLSATNTAAHLNHDFQPAADNLDTFIADDFVLGEYANLTQVYVPGDVERGACDLTCASALHWEIYADVGGEPDGDPRGRGNPPVWELTLPPDDSQVSLSAGTSGWKTNVTLKLATPVLVPPGTWWFVFYPTLNDEACTCRYGRQPADTTNGQAARVVNPGGGIGFPTTWTSVQASSTFELAQQDFAFRLEFASPLLLGDRAWYDTNRDGIQDPGEPGVQHIQLYLYDNDTCWGLMIDAAESSVSGEYLLVLPAGGVYCLAIGIPTLQWLLSPQDQGADDTVDSDVDPATWQIRNINVTGIRRDVDVGLYVEGGVGGKVWCDANNDEVYDAGEERADVTVRLFDDPECDTVANDFLRSEDTDTEGAYGFDNLWVGPSGQPVCYVVTVDTADMGACNNSVGLPEKYVHLDADAPMAIGFDFVFSKQALSGQVGGMVFCDANRDGLFDPGEGMSGVQVTLFGDPECDTVADGQVGTTATVSDGAYLFHGLRTGPSGGDACYVVRVDENGQGDCNVLQGIPERYPHLDADSPADLDNDFGFLRLLDEKVYLPMILK